jgi:hypothetical protein
MHKDGIQMEPTILSVNAYVSRVVIQQRVDTSGSLLGADSTNACEAWFF